MGVLTGQSHNSVDLMRTVHPVPIKVSAISKVTHFKWLTLVILQIYNFYTDIIDARLTIHHFRLDQCWKHKIPASTPMYNPIT